MRRVPLGRMDDHMDRSKTCIGSRTRHCQKLYHLWGLDYLPLVLVSDCLGSLGRWQRHRAGFRGRLLRDFGHHDQTRLWGAFALGPPQHRSGPPWPYVYPNCCCWIIFTYQFSVHIRDYGDDPATTSHVHPGNHGEKSYNGAGGLPAGTSTTTGTTAPVVGHPTTSAVV